MTIHTYIHTYIHTCIHLSHKKVEVGVSPPPRFLKEIRPAYRDLRIEIHHWTLQEGSTAVPYQVTHRKGGIVKDKQWDGTWNPFKNLHGKSCREEIHRVVSILNFVKTAIWNHSIRNLVNSKATSADYGDLVEASPQHYSEIVITFSLRLIGRKDCLC